jgi:hypothetical protein
MEEIKMNNKIIFGILLVIFGVFIIVCSGFYSYYLNYQYNSKIGGYMENAIDMNTPNKMYEQVSLAKLGMMKEGLTKNNYGAWIFKRPDNSMKMQYEHIDSILERIKAVEEWKNKVYSNNSQGVETLGDVYEQKMTNLRKFIANDLDGFSDRSDWIAEDAWYVKNHLIWKLTKWLWYLLSLIIVTIGIVFIMRSNDKFDSYL